MNKLQRASLLMLLNEQKQSVLPNQQVPVQQPALRFRFFVGWSYDSNECHMCFTKFRHKAS